MALAGVRGHPFLEAGEPRAQPLGVTFPEQGDRDPTAQVGGHERGRQVASGDPDPVAGVHPVEDRMALGGGGRVVDDNFGAVTDLPTGIDEAERQVNPLVAIPKEARPAPHLLKGAAPGQVHTLPKHRDQAWLLGSAATHSWGPPLGGEFAAGVHAARLGDGQGRVGDEEGGQSCDHVGPGQEGVVVVEEDELPPDRCRPDVAPFRDADVLRQIQRPYAIGQVGGVPAVADNENVELDALLRLQGREGLGQLGGPIAHGEHHGADGDERGERGTHGHALGHARGHGWAPRQGDAVIVGQDLAAARVAPVRPHLAAGLPAVQRKRRRCVQPPARR